jgi:hypothetical protein
MENELQKVNYSTGLLWNDIYGCNETKEEALITFIIISLLMSPLLRHRASL